MATYLAVLSPDLRQHFYSGLNEEFQWILSNVNEFKKCYPTPSNKNVCEYIAKQGSIDLMKWARDEGCPWNIHVPYKAAHHGHIALLTWLSDNSCPISYRAAHAAAKGGHIHIIEWLVNINKIDENMFCQDETYMYIPGLIAGNKNDSAEEIIEKLEWCRSNGHLLDGRINFGAGMSGKKEIVQWLNTEGVPMDEKTCRGAAYRGHLSLLRWLLDNGCPCSASIMSYSFTPKNLYPRDFVMFLLSRGYQFTCETFYHAVIVFSYSGLRWLREQGCPWNEGTFARAIERGDLTILEWLYGNKCPQPNDNDICDSAMSWPQLKVIEWLYSKGFRWTKEICESCETHVKGRLHYRIDGIDKISKFLKENNCPCGGTLH